MKKLVLYSVILSAGISACVTNSYRHAPFDAAVLEPQSQTQSDGPVTVTASVPGAEQTEALFGVPLYDSDIQPVWLQIENRGDTWLRYAPTGTDRDYFSPLEVAYKHRKGYSKADRASMDRKFFTLGIQRMILPGETRSGFVFTNRSPGTKSLVVDLIGPADRDASFTFFLTVPGFVPDHSEIEFEALYAPRERRDFDDAEFLDFADSVEWRTHDADGNATGLPVTVLLIGSGKQVLSALLRAGWHETSREEARAARDAAQGYLLYGRPSDAVFRFRRQNGIVRSEMHIWLSPWTLNGTPMWTVFLSHFIAQNTRIQQMLFGSLFDPDMNDARNFLFQNLLYNQAVSSFGWVEVDEPTSFDAPLTDFTGAEFFTDGRCLAMRLAEKPVSLLEVQRMAWDDPPLIQRSATP